VKLNNKRTITVSLAFLSICAFWQLYDNIIPLILKDTFQLNAAMTGLVMGIDNMLALFMLPLFGMLSDKTKTRFGRRMPYIVIGTLVAALLMNVLLIAERRVNLLFFMIILCLLLIAMCTYRSPAVALMPDVTPKPLRSKANAIINLAGAVGGALLLFGTKPLIGDSDNPDYTLLFLVISVLMVVCVGILFFSINEPKAVSEAQEIERQLEGESEQDEDAGTDERMPKPVLISFWLILLSIFLWFMGYNAVTSTFTRYAEVEWHITVGDSSRVLLIANIAAIASYLPVGMIATKFGRRKTILGGIVMLAAAFGICLIFTSFNPLIYVFFSLAGIGWAFINVNSYPMVVEMSRGANIGRYTGFYYLASMLAQSVTPFFSGLFIDAYGYRTLMPYGCLFVAASFVTMLLVRHGDSKPVAQPVGLETFDVDD